MALIVLHKILILILFIEILNLLRENILLKNFFQNIYFAWNYNIFKSILCTLPHNSNSIFYIILNKNFKNLFNDLFGNFYFYIFLSIGLFLMMNNIFNSGCILYPVGFTCISQFD